MSNDDKNALLELVQTIRNIVSHNLKTPAPDVRDFTSAKKILGEAADPYRVYEEALRIRRQRAISFCTEDVFVAMCDMLREPKNVTTKDDYLLQLLYSNRQAIPWLSAEDKSYLVAKFATAKVESDALREALLTIFDELGVRYD